MTLDKRLKKLRLSKGLTQKDLAEPLYTHAYISSIEAGRRMPSPAALEHFATRLGVDVEELRSGRPRDLPVRLQLQVQEARQDVSRGNYEAAAESLEQAARQAKRFELTRLEARAEEVLGLCAERRGEFPSAIQHYDTAERILRDEPLTARVEAIVGKARSLQILGDVRYAIHLLEKTLDLLRRSNLHDPAALGRLHASLAFDYLLVGMHRSASESAAEALRLVSKIEDPEQLANMYMNLARVLLADGSPADASDALGRAEELYKQLDLCIELARAHLARGIVLMKEGDLDAARSELELARSEMPDGVGAIDEARVLNELARVERLSGNRSRAIELLQQSMRILRETDVAELALAYRELGLAVADDDMDQAQRHLDKAIKLYEKTDQALELASTYRVLGDLLRTRGELELGSDAYKKGILVLERDL